MCSYFVGSRLIFKLVILVAKNKIESEFKILWTLGSYPESGARKANLTSSECKNEEYSIN